MRKFSLFAKIFFSPLLSIIIFRNNANTQVLWGMSPAGGSKNGSGNIFSLNTDGAGFLERYSFLADGTSPHRQLLLDYGDGYLYGTIGAPHGGGFGGLIYKVLPDGTAYQVVYSFSQGVNPVSGVIKGADGYLYGSISSGGNYGSVYKISINGTGYQLLHTFAGTDGRSPSDELVQISGTLYGVTTGGGSYNYGVVFSVKTDGSGFTVIHHFNGTAGAVPNGPLSVVNLRTGTIVYGTTVQGGFTDRGVLYKLALTGNAYEVLYNFTAVTGSPNGSILKGSAAGSVLYGTTRNSNSNGGLIYSYNTATASITSLHSFPLDYTGVQEANPNGVLLQINNILYGTTAQGGSAHDGVLFKMNTDGTAYLSIHELIDHTEPAIGCSLSYFNNQLYGTTQGGQVGSGYSCGTIYRVNTDGSGFQQIHSFNSPNGYSPPGSLLRAQDGNLYGITTYGGSGYGNGVAFSIKTDGTACTPIQWLDNGPATGNAQGSLIQGSDGSFYGLNQSSGPIWAGTVFKLTQNPVPIYQQFSVFGLAPGYGSLPLGSLLQATDGNLYGTTSHSGQAGTFGTVFKINTGGTGFSIIHTFSGPDGGLPGGSLKQAPDGFLYGMTQNGGQNDLGVVFKMKPDGTAFQTLFQFGSGTIIGVYGIHPAGSLLVGADGKLYGMTYRGGANACGTIFRINTDGTGMQVIYNFNGTNGAYPVGSLIQDAGAGTLYGMANLGGTSNMGTAFKLNSDGSGFVKLLDFNGANGKYPRGDLLLLSPSGAPLRQANPALANTPNAADNSKETVEMAPNPVRNSFTIHYKTATQEKRCYTITDINGQIMKQNNPQSASPDLYQQVNIGRLPPGIYIVKTSIGKRLFVQKIVKQ